MDAFEAFATRHNLTIEAKNVPFRFPARVGGDSEWDKTAFYFAVTIHGADKRVIWQGCYSTGAAHAVMWAQKAPGALKGMSARDKALAMELRRIGRETLHIARVCDEIERRYRERAPITAAQVLESLRQDVSSADLPFEDWCADYGFNVDSRSDLAAYEECRRIASMMRAGLGPAAWAEFLSIEE